METRNMTDDLMDHEQPAPTVNPGIGPYRAVYLFPVPYGWGLFLGGGEIYKFMCRFKNSIS